MQVKKRKTIKKDSTNMSLLVESTTQEEIFEYDKNRIVKKLIEEADCDKEFAAKVANIVTDRLQKSELTTVTPQLIRSFVNVVLCELGYNKELVSNKEITVPISDIDSLIFNKDKSNGNTPHNPESINLSLAGNMLKQYALKSIFPKEIATRHLRGDIHIHDMDMVNRLYCSGHNPEYIKRYGITNMENIPNDSSPANSAWVAARHLASATLFFTSLFAGAIGWDSINMFLAPYCRGWEYKKYKQLAQTLMFDFAQLAGAKGGQVSFTDFNIYATTPNFYVDTYAVGKSGCYMFESDKDHHIEYYYNRNEIETYSKTHNGKILTYKDFEYETQQLCKALLDVSKDGDARGMPFGFPKLHFHINDEVFSNPKAYELYELACDVLSLQGNPYIDFDRNAAGMSQCCRLVLKFDSDDLKLTKTPEELRFVGGQNVSINLANIPLCTNNETEFYKELLDRINIAIECHKIKINYINNIVSCENSPLKFYKEGSDGKPYVKLNKISWLIGIVGLNECVQNLTGKQLHESKNAYLKGLEIITFMNQKCEELSKINNMNLKLEETPAESTAGRFAKLDQKYFAKKGYHKGDLDGVYYTNSIHFAVDAQIDYIDELKYQSKFHQLVDAGSMVHVWVGDKKPSAQAISNLIKKVWENTKCTEMTISPNKTVCNNCKTTVDGFHDNCPNCNSENIFWIARITGYQVRVDKFNASKISELFDRNNHDIDHGETSINFLSPDIVEDNTIKIYSLPNCPNCRKIKNYCDANNIKYTNIDVSTNFKGKARLILENKESMPVVQLGSKFIEYDINNSNKIKDDIKEYYDCLNQ